MTTVAPGDPDTARDWSEACRWLRAHLACRWASFRASRAQEADHD